MRTDEICWPLTNQLTSSSGLLSQHDIFTAFNDGEFARYRKQHFNSVGDSAVMLYNHVVDTFH